MQRLSSRAVASVFAVVCLGSLCSCSEYRHPTEPDRVAPSTSPSRVVVMGEGDTAFPSESLSDWVSYGDVAAVVTVKSEKADAAGPDVQDNHEGLIGRSVTVATVDIIWRRLPTFAMPSTFGMEAWGWTVHDDQRIPTVTRGSCRLEVGHSYLAVFTDAGLLPGWTTISDSAILPADGALGSGERRGEVPRSPRAGTSTGYRALDGKTVAEAASALATAVPDPVAVKYAYLPPAQRWKKVATETGR